MAVGPSSSATSPGSAGLRAYQDLSRYFAWDLGEGAAEGALKTASAKVRSRTIGISLGRFGLDLTTQDVVLDVPAPGSFEAEMASAGLRDRPTSRPVPGPGREPGALDVRRGLSAYARDASGPGASAGPSRRLGAA
ncbi:MAG: hypothetical protein AB1916_08880 [Thermodesulfobacteriota bacterium]